MPEETTESRVLSLLSRMEEGQEAGFEQIQRRFERVDERFNTLEKEFGQRLARLEGGFEQMDKRMANVEGLQRWAIGIMVTGGLAFLGLAITVLFKLP